MLITLSSWNRYLLLIGTDVMLLIFAICRVVSSWCAVPRSWCAAGNRLDLVMTDAPDTVEMFVSLEVS